MKKTLKSLTTFLILNSLMVGCASRPAATEFDAKWEFCVSPSGESKACLGLDDVKKLREILIRCQKCQE